MIEENEGDDRWDEASVYERELQCASERKTHDRYVEGDEQRGLKMPAKTIYRPD